MNVQWQVNFAEPSARYSRRYILNAKPGRRTTRLGGPEAAKRVDRVSCGKLENERLEGINSLNSGVPSMFWLTPKFFETMRHKQFAVIARLSKLV
jgi:hypothetical protein